MATSNSGVLCTTIVVLSFFVFGSLCQPVPVSQLASQIASIINQPQYSRMEWGILVDYQLSNGSYSNIYNLNGDQFFTPASNNKVITTVPAFLFLGQDFKFSTPFVYDSGAGQGCLLGRGDPTITVHQVQQLASAIAANITSFNSIIIDNSFFPSFPGAWEWEDIVAPYGAQPNSLILTQNAVTIKVSPGDPNFPVVYSFSEVIDVVCVGVVNNAVTVPAGTPITEPFSAFYVPGDARIQLEGQISSTQATASYSFSALQPADRFKCALSYYLQQEQVTVRSIKAGKCATSPSFVQVASIETPYSFTEIMNYTLQNSDNQMTECFLRTLGAYFPNASGNAQTKGISAVKQILSSIGVNASAFVQDDGSGLSRHNLLSPRALVQTLENMGNIPTEGAIYRTLLPVAGESGSLKNRFVGTPAQGRVQAKTGSMSGVNSLSGYVDASGTFSQVVFSIITNFSDQSSSVVRQGIDSIVVLLSQLTN